MLESAVNTIIGQSLAWHWKPQDGPHNKSPIAFDGFAIYKPAEGNGVPVYWEAKNLKKPSSFSFKDLQPHQIANLKRIQELAPQTICLFLICVDYGRADKRIFVFKDMAYCDLRKGECRNILKKEFDKRKNFVRIQKDRINFDEIVNMPKDWEYTEEDKCNMNLDATSVNETSK